MRDLSRTIKEYDRIFNDQSTNRGAIFTSDVQQIIEIAQKRGGGCIEMLCEAAFAALKAGIVIGYRRGKKEGRRK